MTVLDPHFVESWGLRFADAVNSHDAAGVAALCTEDVVWNDEALPGPAEGRQAVHDFIAATCQAFPDFHVEETDALYVSAIEPLVLCPYRMTGTMTGGFGPSGSVATGASLDLRGIDQWMFRGELMCRYVTYYDFSEMARQLGTPGSRP